MKIAKLALVIAVAAQVTVTFAAKPKPLVLSYYDWRDAATNLVLEGRGFPQMAKPLVRLPEKFKGVVTPSVWGLSQTTIGFNARFVTDSKAVVVRWRVPPKITPIGDFTMTFFAGVDVYARTPGGAWRHAAASAPDWQTGVGELRVGWKAGDECMVYLPVRARVQEFAVGVVKGASFAPPPPHRLAKPIVHYGTSIVNGGCASRPGMIFPSQMARRLDAEVIDLGFSGAGKMELPMADLVAEIEASAYVVDCEWNMSVALQKQNYEPFVRRLKALRPDTPVLLCGGCTENAEPRATEVFSKGLFDRLRREEPAKWANWHFLSGVDMLPNDSDCTFDHCHPNDYGFVQMGRVYAEALAKILR